MVEPKKQSRRVDAAMGRIPCDGQIRNVNRLDVVTLQWIKGDVSWVDGVIVGTEPGLRAQQVVDGNNGYLVPGFIDAHVHIESSLMLPSAFQACVLPKGTTTAICDPHELTNVAGPSALQYFLDQSSQLSMDLWIMLSSCVPSSKLETNGGGTVSASELRTFLNHPRALGLAEVMNIHGVLHDDLDVQQKLHDFRDRPIDGHSPLLKGKELSAYLSVGISSCHECSERAEAEEKLRKGMSVWIREGSVARDVDELAPILNPTTSPFVGFCTDDRNPYDIFKSGHMDHILRKAIQKSTFPEAAYRSASWSVARHYGLDQGPNRIGVVAPGYQCDLVLLDDYQSCSVRSVWKAGKQVNELQTSTQVPHQFLHSVRATCPPPESLEGPSGQVHVMVVHEGKIITDRSVMASTHPEVMRLSVLERYGHHEQPANGYVMGFGQLKGAIASSVGHDSHNLICIGNQSRLMSKAFQCLIESGGGFCVVNDSQVLAQLSLPIGGLMSLQSPQEISKTIEKLKEASRAIGCHLEEPFLQLAFLSLPVIPSLKLTNKGLVDVQEGKVIHVQAS